MTRGPSLFFVAILIPSLVVPATVTKSHGINTVLQYEVGYLVVTSTRPGTQLWLDDRLLGVASPDTFEVSVGVHRVVAINPNKISWLDRDWSSTVEIRPAEVTAVHVVFSRYYSVNSVPYGASVFADRKFIGETPVVVPVPDTTASVELALEKPGFLPDTLRLSEWSSRFVEVELRRKPGPVPGDRFPRPGAEEGVGRAWKWTYVSAGAALVTGVAALFFKNRADDAYDRYHKAIEPAEIDRWYGQTRRYDTYATVSFTLFQVSFLSSIYFFIKSVNR